MSAPSDLAALRQRLAGRQGRAYWRCLEEAATPDFLAYLAEEVPRFAAAAASSFDRRRFLELMAASLALGGLAACGPEEAPRDRVAYVEQPEGIVPGRARAYATATLQDGMAEGVLVTHQMGRPIKVEGNPDHPASLGATSAAGQAAILSLYDPHRAQTVTHGGGIAAWQDLATAVIERRRALIARGGEGFRLLTGAATSPTLVAQIAVLRKEFPAMRWHRWEAVHRDEEAAAMRLAFGRPLDLVPDFAKADIVLAVESDCVDGAPGRLAHARAIAARRRAAELKGAMSRLYAIESTPTLIGVKADHRLVLAPGQIDAALRIVAASLGAAPRDWAAIAHPHGAALRAIADDLARAKGRALVHVGREQPAAVHALALAINAALGAFGTILAVIEPVEGQPDQPIQELARDLHDGKVDTLVIIGTNPAYSAPADLDFAAALGRAGLSIALSQYADETAARCHWHVPQAHAFEGWGDARAFDGTITLMQPQVRPIFGGRTAHEMLALWLGEPQPDGAAIVRDAWQDYARAHGIADFDAFRSDALRAGVVPNSAAPHVTAAPKSDFVRTLPPSPAASGLTLLFRADIGLWDGRHAENGWLQELPRPFTRLTWDNAALIAPRTAERLGVTESDVVELARGSRTVQAPVWIMPGQAEDCITLPLGYGRAQAGPIGTGIGFDAYRLRTTDAPWQAAGATLAKAAGRHVFAPVQHYAMTDGRDLLSEGTLAAFLAQPDFLRHAGSADSLYPAFADTGIAWAMSINLNSCIGCGACVVACQAENNSPVVGKDEVLRGRDMHWLRVDRYYEGTLDAPSIAFQPVPCMQCENAPCEIVCPVQATVHDSEGLNVMVYNRCVGTRFCSNNCPYKVRRFNFFDYAGRNPRLRQSWNPEVTVRDRGVMEKCTYCVQRTRQAMIDADRDDRPIRDGEVKTACQQACPAEAIAFGNRNDGASEVARRKASPLDYVMLEALNTRPRTSYEAIIRNPNPDFGDGQS